MGGSIVFCYVEELLVLFADDSLLFCQANQQEVQVLNDILQLYAAASGQCINFKKSSIFFQ